MDKKTRTVVDVETLLEVYEKDMNEVIGEARPVAVFILTLLDSGGYFAFTSSNEPKAFKAYAKALKHYAEGVMKNADNPIDPGSSIH